MLYTVSVSIARLQHFVSNYTSLSRFLLVAQLLSKPKFCSVEKIKTIGSTYMAAAGLMHSPLRDEQKVCLVSFSLHHQISSQSLQSKSKCFHPFFKANACPVL